MRKLVSCFITIALLLFGMFQMAPTVSAIASTSHYTSSSFTGATSACKTIRFLSLSNTSDANVFIISKKMVILIIGIILMISVVLILLFIKMHNDTNKFIDFLNTELECSKKIIKEKNISINYLNSGITTLKEKNTSLFSELSDLKTDNTVILTEYECIAEKYNILKDKYKRIILLYPSADYEVTEMIKAEQASMDAQNIQTDTQNKPIVEDTFEDNSYDSKNITETSKPTILAVSDKSAFSAILCLNAIQNLDLNQEETDMFDLDQEETDMFDFKEWKILLFNRIESKTNISHISKLEEKANIKHGENYAKHVLNCRNAHRYLICRRTAQKNHV